jgi:hypothetical protein
LTGATGGFFLASADETFRQRTHRHASSEIIRA